MPAPGDDGDQDSALEQAAVESFPSLITFRDMLQELAARLTPADQIVLAYLADGFGVEEIAAKLHCSHQSVSKRRRRIAREASKLGFEPAPLRSKRHPRRR
jgi:DNA-binding NarL/FixJ family response regulator